MPNNLVVDNGPEFSNSSRSKATGASGIILNQGLPKISRLKPRTERSFKAYKNDLLHLLPGSHSDYVPEKGVCEPDRTACLSVTDLRDLITVWLKTVQDTQGE